jgi:hypothetical protein
LLIIFEVVLNMSGDISPAFAPFWNRKDLDIS